MKLGIDYGRKRIGLAVCGPLKIACPIKMLLRQNPQQDWKQLRHVIEEYEVDEIILGLPKNMNDTSGFMAEEVQAYAKELEAELKVTVILWDERLTSSAAESKLAEANLNGRQRKKLQDSVAAALILQSYIDAHPTFMLQT